MRKENNYSSLLLISGILLLTAILVYPALGMAGWAFIASVLLIIKGVTS